MTRWIAALVLALALAAAAVRAQDRQITLAAPRALADGGLLGFLLPRFSLKTGIRIEVQPDAGDADVVLTPAATIGAGAAERKTRRAFHEAAGDTVWRVAGDGAKGSNAGRFVDWLLSDIGQRTIDSFRDGAVYVASADAADEVAEAPLDGNAALGERLSLSLCGRCHVVGEANRMKGIGSTPSFGALRAIADWQNRFESFYALNPHPAFTQVAEVTPPFDIRRPSPIVPVEMTLDDLEAILAYVSAIAPKDLGAPVRAQ
ncbi:hypothetical protein GE300_10995 [Rhodobacteraceae bacterium 2CG4]|uniref:Cytochrome c domain-containing protein n=1 Tax=Halovulum marinum TaxID=2662447 RepID=A0A6L5Z0R7_9RHOB|nr:hypothetical protein [Halovulum marinum]MSU90137.1 hypothetical protein [Halovulum marinum]